MQKVPHLEELSLNYSKLFRVVYKGLLADAEAGEDGLEDGVGGDFAGDFSEVVHTFADVLRDEVAAQ